VTRITLDGIWLPHRQLIQRCRLIDYQLDQVTGGLVTISIIAILIGQLQTTVSSTKSAPAPTK
jgi:hypothetical protein